MSKQSAEDRILNGQLWNDFCDRLKAAGQLLHESNVPKDRMNQALRHPFLTRILRAGLERELPVTSRSGLCLLPRAAVRLSS